MKWKEKWRLNVVTMYPEKVRVMEVSDDYCLVEGESHTSYVGGFYNSPADAFADAYADCARSIRSANDRKGRLDGARERFERSQA